MKLIITIVLLAVSIIGNAQRFNVGPMSILYDEKFQLEEDGEFGEFYLGSENHEINITCSFLSVYQSEFDFSEKPKPNKKGHFVMKKIDDEGQYYKYMTDLWEFTFNFYNFEEKDAEKIINSIEVNSSYLKKIKLKNSNCKVYAPKDMLYVENPELENGSGDMLLVGFEEAYFVFAASKEIPMNGIIAGRKPTLEKTYSNKYFNFYQYNLDDGDIAVMAKEHNRNYLFTFGDFGYPEFRTDAVEKFLMKIIPIKKK